jgi:glyoxylate reductase
MPKPKVFVTRIIPDAGLEKVKFHCDAEIWPDLMPPPQLVLLEKAALAEGLLATLNDRIDAELLQKGTRLRVVSNFAVGFNNIDVAAASELGIAVGNTPEVLTDATADFAFCLMIAAARRLIEGERAIHDGKWQTWEPMGYIGVDLIEKTIGIVGMGRIGFALAKRCHFGWGMRVIYTDVYENKAAEKELGAERVDLDVLLAESDFVSVHTNLTEETRGLFNATAFRKMKRSAVFVNTARGPLVVEKDLYEALRSGVIFAAGLDVTNPEPMSPDHPLLTLPNAVIAPHIASATRKSRNQMAEIAADNLLAGLDGRPLRSYVNPDVESRRRKV